MNKRDVELVENLQSQIDAIKYADKYAKNKRFIGQCFRNVSERDDVTFSRITQLDGDGNLVGTFVYFYSDGRVMITRGFNIASMMCDNSLSRISEDSFNEAVKKAKEAVG